MSGGLYAIRCVPTGEQYIGITDSFKRRWRRHRAALRAGRHNDKLQAAWAVCGEAAFEFVALVICAGEYAGALERRVLGTPELRETMAALNVGGPGATWSEAWRANNAAAMAALAKNPEWIAAQAAGAAANAQNPEWKVTHAERSRENMKRLHADPEFAKANAERGREHAKRLHADPEFAAAHAERSRENIKRLNADPEFAKANAERGRENVKRLNANPAVQAACRFNIARAMAAKRGVEHLPPKLSRHDFAFVRDDVTVSEQQPAVGGGTIGN